MTDSARVGATPTGGRALVTAFLFSCFFPYPALVSVGDGLGVTIGMVACVVLVLAVRRVWSGRPVVLATGFLVASATSGFVNMLVDPLVIRASSFNALFAGAVALAPLFAVAFMPRPVRSGALVGPVSAALLVHAAVGWYQWYRFQAGQFPLETLYNNPSFANIGAEAEVYALYVRRPFGLFPEPSALAAAIGPFILLLIEELSATAGSRRILGTVAVVAGSSLMLATQSVYLIFWLPLLALSLLGNVNRLRSQTSRFFVFGVVGAGLWAAILNVAGTSRLAVSSNESAQYRLQSIQDGISLWLDDWHSFLVGTGPGTTVDRLQESESAANSVHSLVVTQLVEFGFLAALVWILVFAWTFRQGQRIVTVSWLVSVALVTSYSGLAALWLMLGILVAKERREDFARDTNASLGRSGAPLGRTRSG